MEDDKFYNLLWSLTNSDLKKIISDYNEQCIREGRKEEKMKGYSSLDKDGLVDFISSYLSDEEKSGIIEEVAPNLVKKLISDGVDLLTGEHNREKISEIVKIPNGSGIELQIRGFSWDVDTLIVIEDDRIESQCSCRIGKNDGLCFHQMAGMLMKYLNNEVSLTNFPLAVEKEWLEPYIGKLELASNLVIPKEEADILFTDEYQIYISKDIVTMKWEGQYSGSKTIDVSKEDSDIDLWVSKKVVDKMLKPMKIKAKTGSPRLMKIDRHGILTKIFENQKLVEKISKKFHAVDETLPNTGKDLWDFLRSDLTVDNNQAYENIKMTAPTTKKSNKSTKKKNKTSKKKTRKSTRKKKTSN